MATKRDVAELAGVSPATVSNFYNGKKKMAVQTQKRIIEAAQTLQYPLPSDKKNKSTSKVVLLVTDDISNPHYGNILQGMNSVACTFGIPVCMIQLWDNVDEFCSMLIANRIYAVYFATYTNKLTKQHIEYLRNNGITVRFSWDNFLIDFDMLLDHAVKYLYDLGHRRIAYLSGLSCNDERNTRYHAYVNALEKNNLPFHSDLVIDGIYPFFTDAKSGYWATKTFLEKNIDFTAIIALNDLLAIGSMNALKESGLSIPEDISVIGCDDIILSEFMNPPLTTLRFSAKDIGIRTMYSIVQQTNHASSSAPVVLQTELIIRKSSGKAPEND